MNTIAKLGAFGAVLGVTFAAALVTGAAVGPIDTAGGAHSANDGQQSNPTVAGTRGLSVAENGFRLELESSTLPADEPTTLGLQIIGPDERPVAAFDELHEREMHLILISRNLVDYRHVHPDRDETGRWSIDLAPFAPGSYRVYTDIHPTGSSNITLAADLAVAGETAAVALPAPQLTQQVDGYEVTLAGRPTTGEVEIGFSVTAAGNVVTPDPYLGANGHLIAIRAADLAFLHVHPDEHQGDGEPGSSVVFTSNFPTTGTYRLFFDFSVDGEVRTAAFTIDVSSPVEAMDLPTHSSDDEHEEH